jgi:hypothetical protein
MGANPLFAFVMSLTDKIGTPLEATSILGKSIPTFVSSFVGARSMAKV